MVLECNFRVFVECSCLQIPAKSTCQSAHGTELCGAAQGLHIAIVLGTWHRALWSSSRPTYCYCLGHMAQSFVEQLKACILSICTWHRALWSSSRPTYCQSALGTQSFVEQLKAYILSICTWHRALWSSSRPTYCYRLGHMAQSFVEQLKAYILSICTWHTELCGAAQGLHIVNLHMAQSFVEQLKAYILLSSWAHGTELCGVAQGLHIAIVLSTRLCGVAQGLHIAIVLDVSALERITEHTVHVHFLSHDIRHVLYLVHSHGKFPFKEYIVSV